MAAALPEEFPISPVIPETHYAHSGDVNIAYQVVGDRGPDLVFVMGWVSHLDYFWEGPSARFLHRLASFSRLILFDKRGTGLSDRVAELPTLEQRMDDVRAVMDAAGSSRAALLGISEGAAMCALFAATYPERTSALAMYGAYAKRSWAPDYPWAPTPEQRQTFFDAIEQGWGGVVDLDTLAPSAAGNEQFTHWWATYLRRSASPGAALALARMNTEIDIRHLLPAITVPTLIVHRTGDLDIDVRGSRYMAERIPGAKFVELPGNDHLVFAGDQDAVLDEVELFLTGVPPVPPPDRLLATVLCAEIAGATEIAARLGDRRWRELLDAFHDAVATNLVRFRGREIGSTGGSFLATFDGPARGIHCACSIIQSAQRMGIDVRAGLHTGECDVAGDEVSGVAVQIAARVLAHAEPGVVLVSNTVKDLVAGSGIHFDSYGTPPFRGLPGDWRLLQVDPRPRATAVEPPLIGSPHAGSGRPIDVLSQREREVAALLALGMSNREVADELAITVATAERHVANILNKLGYHSRAQIAAWAVERGLLRSRLD